MTRRANNTWYEMILYHHLRYIINILKKSYQFSQNAKKMKKKFFKINYTIFIKICKKLLSVKRIYLYILLKDNNIINNFSIIMNFKSIF
jgi:hypothetical protein